MRIVAKLRARPRWMLPGLVAACALGAAACGSGGGEAGPGDRIFDTPPWTGEERFLYTLTSDQIDDVPECELLTIPGAEETRLEEHCSRLDGEYRDDTVVIVGSEDLHPVSSERVIVDDESVTHTVEYSATDATFRTFRTEDEEESRETTRELPEPTEEHPEPAWYDDKSLFWMARGLPLASGYEATYTHVINAGAPRVLEVEVRVEARETLETPVGTFDTWKIRFERDNTVYFLWVAVDGERPVVKARIESFTYDLIEVGP